MLGAILSHRGLVTRLALTDFRGRYTGSVLGSVWAILQPLITIAMYIAIFAMVLQVKVGVKGSVTDFGLFLISGMLPFNAVADAIRRSGTIYFDRAHMMRRIPMPPVVLPAARVLMSLLEFGVVLLLFLGLLVALGRGPGLSAFGVLLLLPMHVAMALGLAVGVASLAVLLRDLHPLIDSVLFIWFLATPVFYPRELLPPALASIVDANPMTPLVEGYRSFLLWHELPPVGDLLYLSLVAGFLLLAGRWVYQQTREVIIDHV